MIDFAIDSGPTVTIWTFSSEGVAKVWQIDDGKFDGFVRERLVARDGTIRELDGSGDVEMSDAPSSSSPPNVLAPPLQPESFDGTASFTVSTSTVFTTKSERRHRVHCSQRIINYDADGDILMDDLQDSGIEEDASRGSLDEVTLAQAGTLVYETFHRSESVYYGRGADFAEELTGVARIDIEIR